MKWTVWAMQAGTQHFIARGLQPQSCLLKAGQGFPSCPKLPCSFHIKLTINHLLCISKKLLCILVFFKGIQDLICIHLVLHVWWTWTTNQHELQVDQPNQPNQSSLHFSSDPGHLKLNWNTNLSEHIKTALRFHYLTFFWAHGSFSIQKRRNNCSYTVVCSKELFNTSGVSQVVLFSKPTFLSSSKLFAVVSSCASGILIFAASNSALQIDLLTTWI